MSEEKELKIFAIDRKLAELEEQRKKEITESDVNVAIFEANSVFEEIADPQMAFSVAYRKIKDMGIEDPFIVKNIFRESIFGHTDKIDISAILELLI